MDFEDEQTREIRDLLQAMAPKEQTPEEALRIFGGPMDSVSIGPDGLEEIILQREREMRESMRFREPYGL